MSFKAISGTVTDIEFAWIPNYLNGLYSKFCSYNPYGNAIYDYPLAEEFEISTPGWIFEAANGDHLIIRENSATFSFFTQNWFEALEESEQPDGFSRSEPIALRSESYLWDKQILGAGEAESHECGSEIFHLQMRELNRGVTTIHVPSDLITKGLDSIEQNFESTLASLGVENISDSRIVYWESDEGYDSMSDYAEFLGCGSVARCNSSASDEIEWNAMNFESLVNFIKEQSWDDEGLQFFREALEEFESQFGQDENLAHGIYSLREFLLS